MRLNIDENAITIISVNGEPLNNNYLVIKRNGIYTFRLRLNSTGYEFEQSIEVDWVNEDLGDGPSVELPSAPSPSIPPSQNDSNSEAVISEEIVSADTQQNTSMIIYKGTYYNSGNASGSDEIEQTSQPSDETVIDDEEKTPDISQEITEPTKGTVSVVKKGFKSGVGNALISGSIVGIATVIWLVFKNR